MYPFTGVAVYIAVVPAQTGFCEAAMETLTGCNGFTVMVTGLEVAGLPMGQKTFEVRIQVTTSLLIGT